MRVFLLMGPLMSFDGNCMESCSPKWSSPYAATTLHWIIQVVCIIVDVMESKRHRTIRCWHHQTGSSARLRSRGSGSLKPAQNITSFALRGLDDVVWRSYRGRDWHSYLRAIQFSTKDDKENGSRYIYTVVCLVQGALKQDDNRHQR